MDTSTDILRAIVTCARINPDDDGALDALGTVLTTGVGGKVVALGTGSAKGRPVPMTLMCASIAARDASVALMAGAGMVMVQYQDLPVDDLEPEFTDGQYMAWFALDFGSIRKRAA